MARFPTRTLVLMTLALLSFAWFWWKTHQLRPTPPKDNSLIPVLVLMDGGEPPTEQREGEPTQQDGGEPPTAGETRLRSAAEQREGEPTQQDGGTP